MSVASSTSSRHKLAFIGAGRMAEALLTGLLAAKVVGAKEVVASDVDEARRAHISSAFNVDVTGDSATAAATADFILVAVKPQQFEDAARSLRPVVAADQTVITIAAGVTVDRARASLGQGPPIVRAMPNTPALVNRGISAVVFPAGLDEDKRKFVRRIFEAAGRVVVVAEAQMDAVTAVSGSGPAYFLMFARELAKAGAGAGLEPKTAALLARETFIGAARLMEETGADETELIRAVASPGGTTEAALRAFDKAQLGNIVSQAVFAAVNRAGELSRGR